MPSTHSIDLNAPYGAPRSLTTPDFGFEYLGSSVLIHLVALRAF